MKTNRTWKNVEVSKHEAEQLGIFLYDNEIENESSECYDKIHFEICVNEYEEEAINEFLDELEETA